jgi:DNA repair protein RecN (Recombination protein N)
MLTYLRITNFAILDEVELDLGPGMTVLTGETGAGKSLILDAVALLRGGRASLDIIRTGAEEARIEAVFMPPPGSPADEALRERLVRRGLPTEALAEEGLVVRRVVSRAGSGTKSRIHIAGQLSTAAVLAELVGGLIDLSGQHEHQSLLDVSRHLRLLDRYGVPAELSARMAAAAERLEAASKALVDASLDERARAEREEFLRFQLRELEELDPQPGEDERLRAEQKRLRSVEKLGHAARRGEACLYSGESSVLEQLGVVRRELVELGTLDTELGGFGAQITEAHALLEDVAHGLRRYLDALAADPQRLAEIEDRLHALGRILRKHGPDLQTLLTRRDEMAAELTALTQNEARREAALAQVERARAEAKAVAEELSRARHKGAVRLGKEASAQLAELGMNGAQLLPQLEGRAAQRGDDPSFVFAMPDGSTRRIGATGWDRAELLLRPNPGEDPRPLQRIASGGELSRVMLALRSILGQADRVATCVFDEVDAGIGGATADRVGRAIRRLAHGPDKSPDKNSDKAPAFHKQVLCITHLAQLAAFSDDHYRVEKLVQDGRTVTRIRRLDAKERREEIARMLGGARVTQKSRAHAEELLREAHAVP